MKIRQKRNKNYAVAGKMTQVKLPEREAKINTVD
jgi:hypothetical protein